MNLSRFKAATGRETVDEGSTVWQGWKRAQVTELLKAVVRKVRQIRPDIVVSTTGCAPYVRAYHEAFQDWPSWLNDGTADFVTVMTYSADPKEYARLVEDALKRVKDPSRIRLTVGAYQLEHAPEDLRRELDICAGAGAGGCAVFHYGNLAAAK